MVTRTQAIIPAKMNVAGVRLELLNALRKEGELLATDYRQTVSSWKKEKPIFKPDISLAGGDASVTVEPTGNKKGVAKWGWLDQGTRIRWALMSNPWKSKTKPGRLKSGGGSGFVVIAGRRAMRARGIKARPGIKARGWSKTISRRNTRRFRKGMTLAEKRGAKKLYG